MQISLEMHLKLKEDKLFQFYKGLRRFVLSRGRSNCKILLLCFSYQDVPLQKKTRFYSDADARLAVPLNIAAINYKT